MVWYEVFFFFFCVGGGGRLGVGFFLIGNKNIIKTN